MISEETPPDQVAARVAAAPARKIEQRQSGYAIPGMQDPSTYHIPPDALRAMMINGKHAMVAVASYVGTPMEPGGRSDRPTDMREYMAWIYTSHSRVFFHSRFPLTIPDLQAVSAVFRQILDSASIP
jgi:hypothetical protein